MCWPPSSPSGRRTGEPRVALPNSGRRRSLSSASTLGFRWPLTAKGFLSSACRSVAATALLLDLADRQLHRPVPIRIHRRIDVGRMPAGLRPPEKGGRSRSTADPRGAARAALSLEPEQRGRHSPSSPRLRAGPRCRTTSGKRGRRRERDGRIARAPGVHGQRLFEEARAGPTRSTATLGATRQGRSGTSWPALTSMR